MKNIKQTRATLVRVRAAHRTARTAMENAEEAEFDATKLQADIVAKKRVVDKTRTCLSELQASLSALPLFAEYFLIWRLQQS